jgi:hypothetical protein
MATKISVGFLLYEIINAALFFGARFSDLPACFLCVLRVLGGKN